MGCRKKRWYSAKQRKAYFATEKFKRKLKVRVKSHYRKGKRVKSYYRRR